MKISMSVITNEIMKPLISPHCSLNKRPPKFITFCNLWLHISSIHCGSELCLNNYLIDLIYVHYWQISFNLLTKLTNLEYLTWNQYLFDSPLCSKLLMVAPMYSHWYAKGLVSGLQQQHKFQIFWEGHKNLKKSINFFNFSKGQLISECLFGVLNFLKKIFQSS